MLKLLTVALDSDKLQPVIYTPTATTIGIQLNHIAKGIIIDVSQVEGGYSVKVFEQAPAMPNQQPQRPVIKAMQMVPYAKYTPADDNTEATNEGGSSELGVCAAIFDKYFGIRDQDATCDHFALLINGKNPELKANGKGSK